MKLFERKLTTVEPHKMILNPECSTCHEKPTTLQVVPSTSMSGVLVAFCDEHRDPTKLAVRLEVVPR